MKFPFTEPTSPRYLYINPETNCVHVMMPIVSGTLIGLDNTCKSAYALQAFFGQSFDEHQRVALNELTAYKKALELDISLFDEDCELRTKKQERLEQIHQYIAAIEAVVNANVLGNLHEVYPKYPKALKNLMRRENSNSYSMILRPSEMDHYLRFANPVFSVKRNDTSVFHEALISAYQKVTELPGAKEQFYNDVLASLEEQSTDFENLRNVLKAYIKKEWEIEVDFDRSNINEPVTQEIIEAIIGSDEEQPATAKDYLEALVNTCCPNVLERLVDSPFYSRQNAEELSITTQFFVAIINLYCRANGISTKNFGAILDNDEDLSETIAALTLSITKNKSIEDALLTFVNDNQLSFGLERPLNLVDKAEIKKRFYENYIQIKGSDHFDEFILLDDSKKGPFFNHQSSICCNLAEFVRAALPELNPQYFEGILADFHALKCDITSTNPCVHAMIELSLDELLEKITDEKQQETIFQKLPKEQQNEIQASPQIKRRQLPKLLLHVARGQQAEAKKILEENAGALFLLLNDKFTDYSGRTFNCSAFEYAYWAKDTHMCRMLIQHMDDETKREILSRCEAIEDRGLDYEQNGEIKNSKHFDFMPLVDAIDKYVKSFKRRGDDALLIDLGIAQQDVVAHVAQEYCHPERPFHPLPDFNKPLLVRTLEYDDVVKETDELWFPINESSQLGIEFGIIKGISPVAIARHGKDAEFDMAAITHLNEVRNAVLVMLRQELDVVEKQENFGMSC